MKRSTWEAARLRWDVLNAWAAGLKGPEIAQEFHISAGYVARIIFEARRAGDPRAKRRLSPPGTNPSHDSKGIYRNKDDLTALNERVLDAWASGLQGKEIASLAGITSDYVEAIIKRARKAGDARAARRHAKSPAYSDSRWASQHERIVTLAAKGIDEAKIPSILGCRRKAVQEVLARARKAGDVRLAEAA